MSANLIRGVVAAALMGLLSSPAAAQFQVWVVDDTPGPGVDFSSIQAAISAAVDDDVIVVKAGDYPAFTVNGKSLDISADRDAVVSVEGRTIVRDLGADQFVSLHGLDLTGIDDQMQAGLHLFDNLGAVWVEDARLTGADSSAGVFGFASPGAALEDCSEVVFTRCTLRGGNGITFATGPTPGGHGLNASDSSLTLYETSLRGGFSSAGSSPSGGGVLFGGFLFAEGSNVTGGAGNSQVFTVEPGGPGLYLSSKASAYLFDTTVTGGPDSIQPGEDFVVIAGATVSSLPGTSRSFVIPTPLVAGETAALEFSGLPGDVAYLALALRPALQFVPKFSGVWQMGFPVRIKLFGTIPASGTLSVPFSVPALDAGLEGLPFFAQGAFETQPGSFVLADPTRPVFLATSP